MREPAFTRGHWRADDRDVWCGRPNERDTLIAIVTDLGGEQVEANARLIAEAPSMFEALEMIEAGHGCPSAVARNALAKVRGEANA